jgi:hypothetical protein
MGGPPMSVTAGPAVFFWNRPWDHGRAAHATCNPLLAKSYPVHVNGTDFRPIDKIVGIVLAIFAACGTLCGGGIMVFGGGIGTLIATQGGASQPGENLAVGGAVGGLIFFVGAAIFACYLLNILGAIWIMSSKRKGFVLTAILTGLNALFSLSGATLYTDILPLIGVCIYCILRLNGTWGPQPD